MPDPVSTLLDPLQADPEPPPDQNPQTGSGTKGDRDEVVVPPQRG